MPEYIMQFDVDDTGKLINARRKEKTYKMQGLRLLCP
jgi:hypothetical protein